VLAPLLANILLDDLDRELQRRGHRFTPTRECVPVTPMTC